MIRKAGRNVVIVAAVLGIGVTAGRADEPGPKAEQIPTPQVQSPKEVLALLGVDGSQWSQFQDERDITQAELETVLRILFRLPQLPPGLLDDAARSSLQELFEGDDLLDQRGEPFRLEGRALRRRKLRVPPELKTRFGLSQLHEVQVNVGSPGTKIALLTSDSPAAWPDDQPIDEPVRIGGLFLKRRPAADPAGEFVFVAERVAWFPDRADQELKTTEALVQLAEQGFDVSRLATVRERNALALGAEDRLAFYQMLLAVDRLPGATVDRLANRNWQLGELLQHPQDAVGQFYHLHAVVRRITRVVIEDRRLQHQMGTDHYFQLDVFLPLGDETVRLGPKRPGRETPVFTSTFPATVCMRQLPPPWKEAEDLREEIEIPAVFYRIWPYHSEYVASFDDRQQQVSPLFLAGIIRPYVPPPPDYRGLGVALAGGALLLLLATALGWWLAVRRNPSVHLP